jgi:sucrose-6F-phosphate phosphohydrolase
MIEEILLVTDLDGTLLGNQQALHRFRVWLESKRPAVVLVYATGQTVEAVCRSVARDHIPAPDYVIGSVGTELAEFITGEHDESWESCEGRVFHAATIRRVVGAFAGLELQPEEFQSDLKVSFFLKDAPRGRLDDLAATLASAGVAAELVYSGSRYLDILPRGMNKGTAARFLTRKLGISRPQVIACGDSCNDLPLYLQGFRGVLVANAELELVRQAAEPVYYSPFAHAAGVLDGLRHWLHNGHSAGALSESFSALPHRPK